MPDPILAQNIPEEASPTRPLAIVVDDPDGTPAARLVDLNAQYVTVPTAWTAPTLTNSWADFGGAFPVVQFRKVGDVVQLRGLMKSGASGTSAFTLPVGFRPPADHYQASVGSDVFGMVIVAPTGAVSFTGVVTTWASLAGVHFSVT